MSANRPVYYIDSCILIALLNRYDELHRLYRRIFTQHNSHCDFYISHVAFGETIQVLMNNNVDVSLDEICSKLRHYNIDIKSAPDRQVLVDIINVIKEQDDRLNYNDILIVATAIADPDSTGLITTDSAMIGNMAINSAASYMGKTNFVVSDDPFSKRRR